MDENWHSQINETIGGKANYGRGIHPNPYFLQMQENQRRDKTKAIRDELSLKIEMLSEPRFITSTETSELMEALITMIGATQILELGCHTGRSTLHFLRAIVGIDGAQVVSVDARPTHDKEFFGQPELVNHFQFIEGWTPDCLKQLAGRKFGLVFVDSDHSVEHTKLELETLMELTEKGSIICLHDMPAWQAPDNPNPPPVRNYLMEQMRSSQFMGMMLPSPRQLDGVAEWGENYPRECSPGLAVMIRT